MYLSLAWKVFLINWKSLVLHSFTRMGSHGFMWLSLFYCLYILSQVCPSKIHKAVLKVWKWNCLFKTEKLRLKILHIRLRCDRLKIIANVQESLHLLKYSRRGGCVTGSTTWLTLVQWQIWVLIIQTQNNSLTILVNSIVVSVGFMTIIVWFVLPYLW